MPYSQIVKGTQALGHNKTFSVAGINVTVNLKSLGNWHRCPSLLSLFLSSTRDSNVEVLSFKWINDDDFCLHKIYERAHSTLRVEWLSCFNNDTERIFSHVVNDTWTVFFSSDLRYALGIGPEVHFFDILTSALDLAYIKLAMINDFLALHSAAIILHGSCVLFLAKSGMGKTTLSKSAIRCGYDVLSDDRVFVMREASEYTAYGTPFGRIGRNKGGYPIEGVFILEQSGQNIIEPISKIELFREVWFNEYDRRRRCFGGALASSFFGQLMDFFDHYPTFRLKFKKDFDKWDYLAHVLGFFKKAK